MTAEERELAELIVATLNLEMSVSDIAPEAPLSRGSGARIPSISWKSRWPYRKPMVSSCVRRQRQRQDLQLAAQSKQTCPNQPFDMSPGHRAMLLPLWWQQSLV
jgi:hypothetical protein